MITTLYLYILDNLVPTSTLHPIKQKRRREEDDFQQQKEEEGLLLFTEPLAS